MTTDNPTPPELDVPTMTPEQILACKYVAPSYGDTSDRRQYLLAILWFSGYFGLYAAYFYMGFQGTNSDILLSMKETLNYLTPLTGVVLGYFYTSSVTSRRKDEALATAVAGGGK